MADLTLDLEPGHLPVLIEARLRTGVVLDLPYGLDLAGLLASRKRLLERERRQASGTLVSHPLPDTTQEEAHDLLLPLGRCVTGPDWHWLASCAIPVAPQPDPEPRTFYRTVDYSWAQRAATRPLPHYLHPSSGPYRDVMLPAPALICPALRWHAVGDAAEIGRLLRGISFLGRRRAVGEGKVLEWTVTDMSGLESVHAGWGHIDSEQAITRPCPEACVQRLGLTDQQWRLGHYAIRPPSWHPSRLQELAMTEDSDTW